MSSHLVVIATDLRRTTVKVTPGTYLADVLEEACRKLNLPGDKYLVRHKQKQVDLSVPFRTSGLIGGAKLELVQRSNTPSAVQIALQIPQPDAKEIPGGRLIKKFPSTLTLWKMMRQFESGEASAGKNINITARGVASNTTSGSGQLYYEMPVLNIMGRELGSFKDFQKTLMQLGHNSGNVLIRLSYKRTDQPLFQAMEEIGQFFQDAELQEIKPSAPKQEEKTAPSDAAPVDDDLKDALPQHNHTHAPLVDTSIPKGDSQVNQPVANTDTPRDMFEPLNIFLAPTTATPAAALAPADETDFTPTVAHAQLHQARLLESSRNQRLLSDKEIEAKAAEEAARLAAIKSVLVKVRFPDNTSSDWNISPQDTGSFLYEAVRRVMANEGQSFHLVIPGGRTVIRNDKNPKHNLIKAYKLSGRVLINLVWDDGVPSQVRTQPFLKASVAKQGQAVKMQDLTHLTDVTDAEKSAVAPTEQAPKKEKKEDGEGGKKVPKWFKLGKK